MLKSAHRAARTIERLDQLAAIGTTRPGLSGREQRACELVAGWMAESGLAVSWDGQGNLFGRLAGVDATAAEVWTGSHLDTVPDGGRFDGALGVLCGLEAIDQLRATGPRAGLRVVAFRDEEGWRFGRGFFGSRGACGGLTESDMLARDADGVSAAEALAALAIETGPSAGLPGSFVELHIEQGPVLERIGLPLAEVTAIAGMAGFEVAFEGVAGHAGTVPMAGRSDAFTAASEFALGLRDAALAVADAVATIGDVRIADPAANVIPALVRVTVDVRAASGEGLRTLCNAVQATAAAAACRCGCAARVQPSWRLEPARMADRVRAAIRDGAEAVGLSLVALASGAGHDAGVLAAAGVDSGMLFVRSRNGGVSHRPDELTDEADIEAAIAVLAGALARLAAG